jgi:hypothetical protein
MFNKFNRLESQPSRKRYLHGKQLENQIADCLKGYGMILKDVTKEADMFDKIDRVLVEDGKEKLVAIKARMGYSGDDILIDLYEPYYGPKSDKTKPGRDYVGKYEVYVCLSKDGKVIRVIDGIRQKEIVEDILVEWANYNWQLPVFDSYKYEGCQIRYTRDRSHDTPKVLLFINPDIYDREKGEIKFYDMI